MVSHKLEQLFTSYDRTNQFKEDYYNQVSDHLLAWSFFDAYYSIQWDAVADQITREIEANQKKPGQSVTLATTWYTNNEWVTVPVAVGILTIGMRF